MCGSGPCHYQNVSAACFLFKFAQLLFLRKHALASSGGNGSEVQSGVLSDIATQKIMEHWRDRFADLPEQKARMAADHQERANAETRGKHDHKIDPRRRQLGRFNSMFDGFFGIKALHHGEVPPVLKSLPFCGGLNVAFCIIQFGMCDLRFTDQFVMVSIALKEGRQIVADNDAWDPQYVRRPKDAFSGGQVSLA
jgi:hypothetical protein